MQISSGESRTNDFYYLPLLLAVSIISRFPFVLDGFGEIDATKIAVSVIDIMNHGSGAAFSNFYFTDVVPLYIQYLKWSMQVMHNHYEYLPLVMNYTNAVVGTAAVIPAYFLIRRFFHNSTIAFCAVLALIFAPSFYQSSIMGFPHLIAFFFLLVSLCFYVTGLDSNNNVNVCLSLFAATVFLTIAFLFKSDIVLWTGIYFGLLIMRKIRNKWKIGSAFLIIFISGILFLALRGVILGHSGGTTMSKEGLSKWYAFSLVLPSDIGYYIAQAKPVAYGAGIATFCIGGAVFVYYLFKRKINILALILSWAALPVIFWLVMIGNNARHNMIATLPILAMTVFFFHEKVPKHAFLLTIIVILSNFFLTAPSFSIIQPSGNLFKSNMLLEDRIAMFQSRAKEIVNIKDEKIVVLGTFHNPQVIIELMHSDPSYDAVKIGRENYKILANGREYVFIYFVVVKPGDMKEGVDSMLREYNLHDYLFVSATYDLQYLADRGLKTRTLDIIQRAGI